VKTKNKSEPLFENGSGAIFEKNDPKTDLEMGTKMTQK